MMTRGDCDCRVVMDQLMQLQSHRYMNLKAYLQVITTTYQSPRYFAHNQLVTTTPYANTQRLTTRQAIVKHTLGAARAIFACQLNNFSSNKNSRSQSLLRPGRPHACHR